MTDRRILLIAGPDAVACPRCGAAPGQPCKRGTLGRHPYHLARVEARP